VRNALNGFVVVALLRFAVSIESLLGSATPAATCRVVVFTKIVAYLATAPSSTKLTAFLEAGIQINANESLVNLHSIQESFAGKGSVSRLILDKAETTGSFTVTIQAHDQASNGTDFGEEFVKLLFSRVKGQVPDVQGATFSQIMDELVNSTLQVRK
jgi:hypothetical protein